MASNTPANVAAATMITAYSAVMAPDSGLASTTPIRARRALAAESIAWLMRMYRAVMNRLERCLILCSHRDPALVAGHVSVGTNCPPACLVCRWKTVATSCEYVIVLTFAFLGLPRPGEWPFPRESASDTFHSARSRPSLSPCQMHVDEWTYIGSLWTTVSAWPPCPQDIPPTKAAMQGMTPISTKAGRMHSPVGTSSLTVIVAVARASTLRAW